MKKLLLILFFLFISRGSYAKDSNNPFGALEFLHWNHSWNNYKYAKDDVPAFQDKKSTFWLNR
ncbi:MAG: hypothetical protein NC900_06510 [Candidatus Omnitrophica bacterium]|nr:hypothetical protein [Candidatus Omnitrophota bacterium]